MIIKILLRNDSGFMSVVAGLIVTKMSPKLSGTATNIFNTTSLTNEKINNIS